MRNQLEQLKIPVFYGKANLEEGTIWNYIVFFRVKSAQNTSKTGQSDYFFVAIVNENYVPEGYVDEVQALLQQIPGLKISGDVEYDYTVKPNTDMVIEAATFQVVKARKVN